MITSNRIFEILNAGIKDVTNNFSSYGAHYIRFGLDYPHIYDLMFGNTDINMSLYPDLEALSDASFSGIVEGLKSFMPDSSENDVMIKVYNVWASVHGVVGILRQSKWQRKQIETLEWVENNLEGYLEITALG